MVFAQERVILDTVPCRVLETRQKVLGVQGIKSILISLDLGLKLPRKMLRAYRLKGDAEGTACLGNITERLNLTVSGFGQKIGRLLREDQMTELYLNDERFMPSRFKRFDPGTLALLISALSFFIATTGLIVDGVRMNDMEGRLRLMSQHIDELRANQKNIYNNVEYLYEDGQFLGIEKDIMGDYVNGLKTTHSCEFLRVRGDTVIMKLESQLNTILDSIFSKKLMHSLISGDALRKMTTNAFFEDSIYLINPSELYTLGQFDVVSFKQDVVTFMLTFPFIRRTYEYKAIEIVESPVSLLLSKSDFNRFHSFLIPINVPLTNVSFALDEIRSTQNCIRTKQFLACDGFSFLPNEEKLCIGSLIGSFDRHCDKRDVHVFDFNVEYYKDNALVYLKEDAVIVDGRNGGKHLYQNENGNKKCVYLSKRPGLYVRSKYRTESLFPSRLFVSVHAKTVELSFTHTSVPNVIKNYSRPIFNRTKTFTPVHFAAIEDTDIVAISAIIVSTIVFTVLLIICICRFVKFRQPTVDGNELFPPHANP